MDYFKKKLDKLKVKCPNEDCLEKLIPYNQVIAHRELCYIDKQPCIFGCKNDVLYKGKDQHLAHA